MFKFWLMLPNLSTRPPHVTAFKRAWKVNWDEILSTHVVAQLQDNPCIRNPSMWVCDLNKTNVCVKMDFLFVIDCWLPPCVLYARGEPQGQRISSAPVPGHIQIRRQQQTDLNSHTLSTWMWILKDDGQEERQRRRFPPSHASYLQLRKPLSWEGFVLGTELDWIGLGWLRLGVSTWLAGIWGGGAMKLKLKQRTRVVATWFRCS